MNLLMNTIPMAEARLRRIPRDTLRLEGEEPADMSTCTKRVWSSFKFIFTSPGSRIIDKCQ